MRGGGQAFFLKRDTDFRAKHLPLFDSNAVYSQDSSLIG